MDDRKLGGRFWLGLIGLAIGLAAVGFLLFLLIDRAVYRWGFLGALVGLGVILIAVSWIVDRRSVKRARAEYDS